MGKYKLFVVFAGCLLGLISTDFFNVYGPRAEDFSDKIRRPVEQTIEIRQQTQRDEDLWAAEKEKLSAQYEMLLEKHQQLLDRNAGLEKETDYYSAEIKSLTKRIEDAGRISKEMQPYLVAVIDQLKRRLDNDIPFLISERSDRINKLQAISADPEIDISEKYRKTMEAVLIEAEYGNTIEVYPEQITVEGQNVQARIFRLGRVSMFFQSLDQKYSGFYDAFEERWKYLPEKFNRDIGTAVEMGLKRRPVDLVNLPLGRIAAR